MTESFLHYVWQFQYFEKAELLTTNGEPINIIHTGFYNTNAGPDFQNARIRIGDIEWVGNVEIHIQSSGWFEHHHQNDRAYDNVILHVVWNENKSLNRIDGSSMPTLELAKRVSPALLLQFRALINHPDSIPCSSFLHDVRLITRTSMIERAVFERLEKKSVLILQKLKLLHNDWEETAYQLLCRNFGFKVNADPFEMLAKSLPYKFILKHADQLVQIEALLFGQAGFLDDEIGDEYYQHLKREYHVLSVKFSLAPGRMHKHQWKYLRLRPANFPTIRIAQLAMLLFKQRNLFSKIIGSERFTQLVQLFDVTPSEYWQRRYQFGEEPRQINTSLGGSSLHTILINTASPLMVAYGKANDDQRIVDRAFDILQNLPAEQNSIVNNWKKNGLIAQHAFDSQGLLQLYQEYCLKRRCLECNIGSAIIRPSS